MARAEPVPQAAPTWVQNTPCDASTQNWPQPPAKIGETLRYAIDLDGLSLARADTVVARRTQQQNQTFIEYRSRLQTDQVVQLLLPVQGDAASLVPVQGPQQYPHQARQYYRWGDSHYFEQFDGGNNRQLLASWQGDHAPPANLGPLMQQEITPAFDWLSAFYALRGLPKKGASCLRVYGHHQTYRVWLRPDGSERVSTPVGRQQADCYEVYYESLQPHKAGSGRIWLSQTQARIPLQMQMQSNRCFRARLQMYAAGN